MRCSTILRDCGQQAGFCQRKVAETCVTPRRRRLRTHLPVPAVTGDPGRWSCGGAAARCFPTACRRLASYPPTSMPSALRLPPSADGDPDRIADAGCADACAVEPRRQRQPRPGRADAGAGASAELFPRACRRRCRVRSRRRCRRSRLADVIDELDQYFTNLIGTDHSATAPTLCAESGVRRAFCRCFDAGKCDRSCSIGECSPTRTTPAPTTPPTAVPSPAPTAVPSTTPTSMPRPTPAPRADDVCAV